MMILTCDCGGPIQSAPAGPFCRNCRRTYPAKELETIRKLVRKADYVPASPEQTGPTEDEKRVALRKAALLAMRFKLRVEEEPPVVINSRAEAHATRIAEWMKRRDEENARRAAAIEAEMARRRAAAAAAPAFVWATNTTTTANSGYVANPNTPNVYRLVIDGQEFHIRFS
ncbi:MAG: hypothetical protein ACREM8_07015 [Vulcanimicrobiaceae bacterium]